MIREPELTPHLNDTNIKCYKDIDKSPYFEEYECNLLYVNWAKVV